MIGLALLAAAGHFACSGGDVGSTTAAAASAQPVVARGDLVTEVLLTGELIAEDAAVLVAPHANVWPLQIRWLIEDGSEVQPGDLVVEFDNSQLVSSLLGHRLQVVEAASRLASLRASAAARLATAEFVLEQSRAALERAHIDSAVPEGVVAVREHERLQLELRRAELEFSEAEFKLEREREVTTSEVEIQRIALDQARIRVGRAEAGAEILTLRAPRPGIVIVARNRREDRTFYEGDTVWPGQIVATLPDLATMVVSAHLFDVDDGLVVAGMPVVATLDTFPEEAFSGRVREVDRFAQKTSWRSLRRAFGVVIDLEDLDTQRMLPGMSVKAVIRGAVVPGVPLIPRVGLLWRDDTPHAVLADGSTVEVELGPCDTEACEVKAGVEVGTALSISRSGASPLEPTS